MTFAARAPGTHHPRTGALAAAALAVVLLAGCGSGSANGGGKGEGGTGESAKPSPVVTPAPTSAPVPAGKGSAVTDDMNGDGYQDLQIPVPEARTGYVLGSEKGLVPDARIITAQKDPYARTLGANADLDGDGYADSLSTAADPTEVEGPGGVIHAGRNLVYVQWGSAKGPQADAEPTRLRLPPDHERTGSGEVQPVVGDFDGDGNADVAAVGIEGSALLLMYGPIGRDGVPSRTDTRATDTGGWGALVTDGIDPAGKRPSSLLARHGDDGEQAGNTLFAAGPDGLPGKGRRVREGSAAAFGDFDGDGRSDVAVGDNGSRNNEPGYETEAPEINESVSIYYGGSSGAPQRIEIPRISGNLAAADTDGDGRSELAVDQRASDGGKGGGSALLTLSRTKVEKRVALARRVPARVDGAKVPRHERLGKVFGAGDFNGDGKDEVVLKWRAEPYSNGAPGKYQSRWWVTDGAKDLVVFTSKPYLGAGTDAPGAP